MHIDYHDIDYIVTQHGRDKSAVVAILHAIQDKYNYLPQPALNRVCEISEITPADIIGVATFYSKFRLKPVGDHLVKVCTGTACHVKGSELVSDAFKRELPNSDNPGKYSVEEVACLGCCTLAPVVQIDEHTYGHVSSDQAKAIFKDFEKQKTLKQQQKSVKTNGQKKEGQIRVGLGSCCVASGSEEVKEALEHVVSANEINVDIKQVGCVGLCHHIPLIEVIPDGREARLYAHVKPEEVKTIVEQHFRPKGLIHKIKRGFFNLVENIQSDENWDNFERYSLDVREGQVNDFLGKQIAIATEHRGLINPLDFDEYINHGGFKALNFVLNSQPGEIVDTIKSSGIRGRGGGGFQTGLKWEMVARQEASTKYVICNGDEGDPGAFMDRMILESYPFRIIEGMLIAAFAVGASEGKFYIRNEYPLAVKRISRAIKICRKKGLLGEDINSSGFDFKLEIVEGGGAFVCGEETALIASIEGKRGSPQIRPPYPAEQGLFDKPTLVNNTETFAQIPFIIRRGAAHFASIGTSTSKGTKVFALAGKVNRGGLIEIPMGMTIREIVEDIGGGVAQGRKFKAVQIGGPSGGCIPYWLADTPVDFESLQAVGAMMGSGGMVVLDDTDCMVDIARYFLSFTQNESCGKCTFCRVGTRRMLDILDKICSGKGSKKDLKNLEDLSAYVTKGSVCGLGKTAPNPVLSTLTYFREEFEAHINGSCPTGKCKALIKYSIDDNCNGCTICFQRCPADAIPFTPHKKHVIIDEKCIKCDNCRIVCPENAVCVN
jgi:NADH:ubiquinone oxidoreductase subunit F (NADH-binding)/NADH:ubiquinone oxidoreductase subunit E/NAD-dependent dihydropyrimidine dehydrogenase PreA subunit